MDDQNLRSSALGTVEYWEKTYEKEIQNFSETGDIGEIWFGEDSVNKMIDWVLDNIDEKTTAILDLGCGNGHLLLELDSFGYSNLCGMDYSEKAIELARNVANSRSQSSIRYICWDLFASPPEKSSESKYGLIMDKGTLDAIALSPNNKQFVEENGVTLVKSYVEKVTNLLSDDGVLLITSCNFTRPELLDIFDKNFMFEREIGYRKFQFGGKTGQTTTTLVLRKKK